jgi:hypothetical protein
MGASMFVSKKFIVALKLNSMPAYKIAWSAGANPTVLSKLIHGIEKPKPQDHRIISVGKLLGLTPEDCFNGEVKEQYGYPS